MFGRRPKKRDEGENVDRTEETSPGTESSAGTAAVPEEPRPAEPAPAADSAGMFRAQGPWDAQEDVPDMPRVDFGSLRVPLVQGIQLALNVEKESKRIAGLTLAAGKTRLQLLPPQAAPKSSGLWEELREEISAAIAERGGQYKEFEGPFGPEVRALVPVPGRTNEKGEPMGRLERHIGVDGPRWLLRGVIAGEGARDPKAAVQMERIFQGIVVVRGDSPLPPKSQLEIRLSDQAQELLARAQRAAAQKQSNGAVGSTPEGSGPAAPPEGTDGPDRGGA